jgi:hypothetical protein
MKDFGARSLVDLIIQIITPTRKKLNSRHRTSSLTVKEKNIQKAKVVGVIIQMAACAMYKLEVRLQYC